ncbi:MAG TPA: TadE/TadG family type IV pilus assembly protein [Gemmatimonadales bacterium]|nr:TadE/TadG family type IV pilus assembly protein [Gemmatimonadales bacterium]
MRKCQRILRGFSRSENGQALVEFALLTPFLLVFLVGILEFGRAWNAHIVVTQAAREGARKAAIYDEAGVITADSVRHAVMQAIRGTNLNGDSTQITLENWDGPSGDSLVVTVAQPYAFLFFGELKKWTTGESRILLKSRFVMRNE